MLSPLPFMRILGLASALAIGLGGLAALPGVAHADEEGELFGSFLRRYVVLDAPAGQDLLARIVGPRALAGQMSRLEMLQIAENRLRLPEFAAERAALDERLAEMEQRYLQTPKGKLRGIGEHELDRDERVWFNFAAEREFRVNPEWNLKIETTPGIDFLQPGESMAGLEGTRASFLREVPDPAFTDEGKDVAVSERPNAARRFKRYLEDMHDCVAALPPKRRAKIDMRYIASQAVIDVGATLSGAIIAAGGGEDVDWKTMPLDLAFELASSVQGSRIGSAKQSFNMRWIRMQVFGVEQSGADMVIYYFTRAKGAAQGRNLSTVERGAYNTAWNSVYAPINAPLYELIAGLEECSEVGSVVVYGTQLATGLGLNYAYFRAREATIGSDE